MKPVLELKNIHLKGEKSDRLNNLNLKIYQGQRIVLLGPSGSGKSSLIKIANGSLYPDSGEVRYNGIELRSLKRRERLKIATLWQDLRLIEELSTIQNINAGALGRHSFLWALKNLFAPTKLSSSLMCLKAVGLSEEDLNTNVSNLSGGQRQRVAIARCLMQKGEILLADEPLQGLDPRLAKDALHVLLAIKSKHMLNIPNTSLIALHRPDLINYFDRLIGIRNGKIMIDNAIKEVDYHEIEKLYR